MSDLARKDTELYCEADPKTGRMRAVRRDVPVRSPIPALQCEILLVREGDQERNEALGLELEVEEEWAPGMVRMDKILFAHWTENDGGECVRLVLDRDMMLIRMGWEEFWEIYSEWLNA